MYNSQRDHKPDLHFRQVLYYFLSFPERLLGLTLAGRKMVCFHSLLEVLFLYINLIRVQVLGTRFDSYQLMIPRLFPGPELGL